MRGLISVLGSFILMWTLACGDSPDLEGQPNQSAGQSQVISPSWAPEEQFSEEQFLLPVEALQGPNLPSLDLLDPQEYVTFTRQDDGSYRGTAGGITFIMEF